MTSPGKPADGLAHGADSRRWAVVAALFVLSMITYIDRVCISAAKEPISGELQLSDSAMGLVFSAFALGYALAQIPAGWFADRAGPRIALAVVVGAWSFLTALTGAAWNLVSLVAIRFLFGIGEAGAFPGSARAIVNWLPTGERGRANGILFSGSRLGAALAFPLLTWMLARWSWRLSFLILGGAGVLWAVVWLVWFRDHPERSAASAPAPAAQASVGSLLRSRGMLLAMGQYFAGNFTFFLCLSWMLPYMKAQYALSDTRAAAYAMVPLLLGAASQWLAGTLVDRLYRSSWRAWSRRLPAILGFAAAAAALLALTRVQSAEGAMVCFTLAAFGADMTISPSWVYCADIGRGRTGSVSGAMNMFGNFGSFVSANAFPLLHRLTGSASAYFTVAALMNVAAVFCWLRMKLPKEQAL